MMRRQRKYKPQLTKKETKRKRQRKKPSKRRNRKLTLMTLNSL